MRHTRLLRATAALGAVATCLIGSAAWAAMEVTAPDGRRVMLKDDFTWEYIMAAGPDEHLLLTLEKRTELTNGCRLTLRMTNNTTYKVHSIVPQFSAVNRDGVVFETVFAAFTLMKPTTSQFQEITFRGIRCEDISRVTVHGADRCSVGELTRFSPATGECLRHIRVQESDVLPISK